MASAMFPLVAVDIGNSRVKFALFDASSGSAATTPGNTASSGFAATTPGNTAPSGSAATTPGNTAPPVCGGGKLPVPSRTLDLDPRVEPWDKLDHWLDAAELLDRSTGVRGLRPAWWIGSVARQVTSRLVDHLRDREITDVTLISAGDLPLSVRVPRPDMVGIDRLLGAVAANEVRDPNRAAIVVDLGSAITVDLVGPDGSFRGGAILPGIGMSARALNEFTDLLPLIEMHALSEPPPPVGDATIPAMTSGLFWGAVGGVSRLIELFGRQIQGEGGSGTPQVLLTGGAAPSVAKLLPGESRYEPDLVPAGIALAAARAGAR